MTNILKKHFEDPAILVSHQTETFHALLDHEIRDIIAEHGVIKFRNSEKNKEYLVQFSDTCITKPIFQESNGQVQYLTPYEARIRNLSYMADLLANVTMTVTDLVTSETKTETTSRFRVCRFPIMVKSKYCHLYGLDDEKLMAMKECPNDLGGYFIINGSEKVVIGQERMASNTLFVFNKGDTHISAEVHSMAANYSTKTLFVKYSKKTREFTATLPFVKQEIPVVILLRALGMTDDKVVRQTIGLDPEFNDYLAQSFESGKDAPTEGEAHVYIAQYMNVNDASIAQAKNMLVRDLLPHCSADFAHKAAFLCFMIKRSILVLCGHQQPDDRDHYSKKRVDFTGSLIGSLFKALFKRFMNDTARFMLTTVNAKREINLQEALKTIKITNGLKYSLATGNWGDQKNFAFTRIGVSQVLNRYNYVATLSHLRRINTPVGRDGKLAKPRLLHNSQWGLACPSETPEGQACGLLKNMAMTCSVSKHRPVDFVVQRLEKTGMIPFGEETSPCPRYIFVNGHIIGSSSNIEDLADQLRGFRRKGMIHADISISIDDHNDCLHVCSDYGRLLRPLFVVNDDQTLVYNPATDSVKSWSELVDQGIVEYLDSDESENALIAVYSWDLVEKPKEYTHCELDPSVILGTCASNIPFPDHNQAPRNTYQSAMGKQAIGYCGLNVYERMDTISNVLHYPQRPLVQTDFGDLLHTHDLPIGENAIVAVITRAFNQEDSLILNKSSVDRGLFRSTTYHSYTEEERRSGHMNKETIEKPCTNSKIVRIRQGVYDQLDNDGIAAPSTKITGNSIIVGKTTTISSQGDEEPKVHDVSCRVKHGEEGVVDKVVVTTNGDGHRMCKVRMRSYRVPEIGDKFASRHGQKGICAAQWRQEDMPFTKDGIVPDVILNPHAIPSRMTIGHLLESLLGKAFVMEGKIGNGTAFNREALTPEEIGEILVKHGFSADGCEELYDGTTGELMQARIFITPVFYQRLKHQVRDKQHCRAYGPLQVLNRQPTDGRSRNGGLRLGEMESQCQIGHGSSAFLKDRLLYNSDKYSVNLCKQCGLTAQTAKYCKNCSAKENEIVNVDIPYACKLLFQELQSMGVAVRVKTE
ncbi:DNA-directed RNA polymerase II subunit RPB2 [Allomyces arbusculus]|nr:DNA-directed RNA polymerase II subunit RPB2 [Allomyces arbusculus]